MSVRQLAYDFFESDELRTLFMRACTTSTGCFPDDVPGLQGLVHNLPLVLSFEPAAIAVGGSQAISDALVSAGRKLGVEYFTELEVGGDPRRRRARHGRRARGRLDRRAPTSSSAASACPQTVLRLLPTTRSRDRLRHRISNIHYDRGQLWWANLALHEPPDYGGDGRPAAAAVLGRRRTRTTSRAATRPRSTSTGSRRGRTRCRRVDTLWDPSRAPEGKHLVGLEEFAAPRRLFDDWARR